MRYFIIYGRETCPYCCKACEVLKKAEYDFMFCEMEHSPNLINLYKTKYNMTTVPIVIEVISGTDHEKLIGGCTDLISYIADLMESTS